MARQPVKKAPDTLRGIVPIADVQAARTFVLYGRSGTGKTTLAGTFPKPILLLDVMDEGTDSIRDLEGIDVKQIDSCEEFEFTYWYLEKGKHPYKTIVIDTVSQLQSVTVQEHAARHKNKGGTRAGDWGTLTRRDWGDISAWLKEWLVNYRDLARDGINIVFIAQDRTFNIDDDESEAGGEMTPEVGPALSPSIVKTLNAAVSVIGNTFIRVRKIEKEDRKTGRKKKLNKIEHCMRVGPNPVYITKVRKPRSVVAPDVIVDPSYDAIIEIMESTDG